MSHAIPKYRRHPNGQAFVQHASIARPGHRLYLGRFGSAESRLEYAQFLERLAAADGSGVPATECDNDPTVYELSIGYLAHCDTYYVSDGKHTSEYGLARQSLKPLLAMFGETEACTFGPKMLTLYQRRLVQLGYCRHVINGHVSRVKRFFRWACRHELIPPAIYHSLASVDGLRQGRSGAKDLPAIEPVAWSQVQVVLPFLSPTVAAMVEVQFLCGMRPGEVTIIRRSDIDQSVPIWIYSPARHKNAWRGQSLVKAIPLRAQAIMQRFFRTDADAYLFSPRDALDHLHHQRAARAGNARTTKAYPCELRRRQRQHAATSRRTPLVRDHYDTHTYRQAIAYGIAAARRAGWTVVDWSPNQLRHSIATAIAQTIDHQSAQRWLGHKTLATTGIYVEQQISDLMAIAREVDRQFAG